jgi:hypothetical protein
MTNAKAATQLVLHVTLSRNSPSCQCKTQSKATLDHSYSLDTVHGRQSYTGIVACRLSVDVMNSADRIMDRN